MSTLFKWFGEPESDIEGNGEEEGVKLRFKEKQLGAVYNPDSKVYEFTMYII